MLSKHLELEKTLHHCSISAAAASAAALGIFQVCFEITLLKILFKIGRKITTLIL